MIEQSFNRPESLYAILELSGGLSRQSAREPFIRFPWPMLTYK